jgi:transposase-like protein
MKFSSITQIKSAIAKLPVTKGRKRKQYSVMFKKALVEFANERKIIAHVLSPQLNMNPSTVHSWFKQYDDGLYTLEGTYSVSTRMKTTNVSILASLDKKILVLQEQKEIVERAQAMGFTVAFK